VRNIPFSRGAACRAYCILGLLLVLAGGMARAETANPQSVEKPTVGGSGTVVIPDAYKLNMLIRTTLIALSQANQTGNYSVLRDLGTPNFQASNTDARLGEIFASLRQRKLDFSPILFFDPKLIREPAIQSNGLLRLTGYFDTRPERVLFDMGFELVDGTWRVSAIIVDMKQAEDNAAPAATATPGAKAAPATPKQAKPKKKPAAEAD